MTFAGGDTLAVLVKVPADPGAGDRRSVLLVVGDTAGNVFGQEDFTGTLERALAWDGRFFWSCGDDPDGGSLLYRIKADTVRVEQTFSTPGHRPMDMTFDGGFLWITDRDNGRIDRIDPATGDLTRSVAAPGFSPAGVAWDGSAMWVTDSGTGRLTRMRGGRLEIREEVEADDWFQRDRDALLAHDGRSLWVLRAGETALVRLVRD